MREIAAARDSARKTHLGVKVGAAVVAGIGVGAEPGIGFGPVKAIRPRSVPLALSTNVMAASSLTSIVAS